MCSSHEGTRHRKMVTRTSRRDLSPRMCSVTIYHVNDVLQYVYFTTVPASLVGSERVFIEGYTSVIVDILSQ